MKGFELNVFALAAQHVHDQLEVLLVSNVPRHDVEIGTVEQDLAEKLERLSLGDMAKGLDERHKGRKELCGG